MSPSGAIVVGSNRRDSGNVFAEVEFIFEYWNRHVFELTVIKAIEVWATRKDRWSNLHSISVG